MRSQGGVEVCRALGPAHGSKKHLCGTMGPKLRPRRRRQRLHLESTSRPSPGKGRRGRPPPHLPGCCSSVHPHEPRKREGAGPCGML